MTTFLFKAKRLSHAGTLMTMSSNYLMRIFCLKPLAARSIYSLAPPSQAGSHHLTGKALLGLTPVALLPHISETHLELKHYRL